MKEKISNYEPTDGRPEPPVPAVERLRSLCSTVRSLDADRSLNFTPIPLPVKAAELEAALREKQVGRIMLQAGESFSIEDTSGYYPDLAMRAGEVALVSAGATAWTWEFRDDSSACQLDTTLWYRGSENSAAQQISLYASNSSTIPSISRSLIAPEYAETGYEGHRFIDLKPLSEESATEVLDVVEPLVEQVVDIIRKKIQKDISGNS